MCYVCYSEFRQPHTVLQRGKARAAYFPSPAPCTPPWLEGRPHCESSEQQPAAAIHEEGPSAPSSENPIIVLRGTGPTLPAAAPAAPRAPKREHRQQGAPPRGHRRCRRSSPVRGRGGGWRHMEELALSGLEACEVVPLLHQAKPVLAPVVVVEGAGRRRGTGTRFRTGKLKLIETKSRSVFWNLFFSPSSATKRKCVCPGIFFLRIKVSLPLPPPPLTFHLALCGSRRRSSFGGSAPLRCLGKPCRWPPSAA
jgi:hypothetical protein